MTSFLLIFILPLCALGAQNYSISGKITDGTTFEPIPFANIVVKGTDKGTTSDNKGNYSIDIPGGNYQLVVSYIGYKTEELQLNVNGNVVLNVSLFKKDILLQEITVYSNAALGENNKGEISSLSLQSKTIGEVTSAIPDVMRSIQTLPGVSTDNEFSAKFNVRGGNYDENLVLVNNTQVYEPFHIKEADNASIGIFNINLIKKVDFIPGGFGARYGDKLSSVLNIEYREGNRNNVKGAVNLSLTNLDGYVEGPLGSDGSFIFGIRKSYLEYALSLINTEESAKPSFYDVQGVLTFNPSATEKLQFKFIHAGDKFTDVPGADVVGPVSFQATLDGNPAAFTRKIVTDKNENSRYFSSLLDLQSTSIISSSALLKMSLSYYDEIDEEYSSQLGTYNENIVASKNYFVNSSYQTLMTTNLDIKTFEANASLDYQLTPYYEMRIGGNYKNIKYNASYVDQQYREQTDNLNAYYTNSTYMSLENKIDPSYANLVATSFKMAGYIENILQVSNRLIFNLGGRADYFDIDKDITLSPRLSTSYDLGSGTTLRAAWGYYFQSPSYQQLLYPAASDSNTQSQKATHYILGVEHSFAIGDDPNDFLKLKMEAYYKKYDDLISSNRQPDGRIDYSRKNDSKGFAKGFDLYAELRTSNFYSWLSYGLLYTKEDLLNDNKGEFPRFTDQRHTLSVVTSFELGRGWSSNVRFTYGSGYAYTPQVPVYNNQTGIWNYEKGVTNSAYLPSYKRIDLRVAKELRLWGLNCILFLDVSNLTNFKNVQGYDYKFNADGTPDIEEVKVFPIIPTLGITANF